MSWGLKKEMIIFKMEEKHLKKLEKMDGGGKGDDMVFKMAAKNLKKPGRSVPENKECGEKKGEQ